MYKKLITFTDSDENDGWGAKAHEYAEIPKTNRIFNLKKELLYEIVEKYISTDIRNSDIKILDFNCGCGNDFDHFLSKGYQVYGCDGAKGMLNIAGTIHKEFIQNNKLHLYHGQSEQLQDDSFGDNKFDIIFSTTGGFSYVDDKEFVREHKILLELLKPNGKMIVAHLTPFCLSETLYEVLHLRFRKAIQRWKGQLSISVKNKIYNMYLRSYIKVKDLLKNHCKIEKSYPILAVTFPYQTGYNPRPSWIRIQKYLEKKLMNIGIFKYIPDQIAFVISK